MEDSDGRGGEIVVDHQFRLMEGLWMQKLEGKFCDVVIKVLEHCVSIHSCVLAAFSSGNLFTENVIEVDICGCEDLNDDDRQNKDLYSDALDRIVDFIYRGKLHFEEKNVRLIKAIADRLHLDEVANLCLNFMCANSKKSEKVRSKTKKQLNVRKIRRNNIRINPSDKYTSTKTKFSSGKRLLIRGRHSRKRYTCTNCGFFALKVKPLLNHLKEKRHDGTLCSLCNFQASTNTELFEHLQKHDDEKPFFCFSCSARFQTRTALNLHLPKHSTEKPYVCNECGKGFKWKHALQNHVILHTNSKQHLCDQCGYRTAHQSSFKAHCLLHSGDTFKCVYPGCNFQASRKQNLKQHAKTHSKEKPFQCEVCGHAFSLVKNLRRHARIHNANENLIRCESCDFSTTRVDKLKEHNKRHHGGVKGGKEGGGGVGGEGLDSGGFSEVVVVDSPGGVVGLPTLQLFPVYTLVTAGNVVSN